MFSNPFSLVDILILILALIMFFYTIYISIKIPNHWIKILPLSFWAFHLAVFYAIIIIGNISCNPLSNNAHIVWSTIQRLHGVITMFYMTWVLINSDMTHGKF